LVAPVLGDQLSRAEQPAGEGAGDTAAAEAILGHRFARPQLLAEALTHRSAVKGASLTRGRTARSNGRGSNERLEFVGDRVLGLVMAEWLAERFPGEQEGQLGPRLAQLVSQPILAEIAEALGVPATLSVGVGETKAGVRRRATVLADAMEAAIGALYFDGGLDAARIFIRRAWGDSMVAQSAPPKDPKTGLQELLLGRGQGLPVYAMVSREGPPHDPVFVISVSGAGQTGTGRAGSKRVAERLAAEELLGRLTT
jgi:ribonuclease-3